uniref:taste receptor type 1 member 1-like n=1 Tax=Solea senegalensis TaxID=28829 RepID=UPI001CD8223F|nr:taste receptor type 1 member 1-like [Solea senegalensis]
MKHFHILLCLLESLFRVFTQCTDVAESEFWLEGDYLIGGLFDIHQDNTTSHHIRPEATDCSSKTLTLSSYRRFQLMRFAVEEINNSTNLLPNVSLGYEIFDHCSASQNFPGIFDLLSVNGSVYPWGELQKNLSKYSKVFAVVGPFSSSETMTTAPLFMMDLIPMVSYGAASSAFSEKVKFPSFLRTVHSNEAIIDVIVEIILHFKWRWVSFLQSNDDFGTNGLELLKKKIARTDICLAYSKTLFDKTNSSQIFKQINAQMITVIIVFAPKQIAEALILSAIELNITNKVWIAGDTWSLNERLLKMKEIRSIGTVLGVSQSVVTIPGFSDFIYSTIDHSLYGREEQQTFCNQLCSCRSLSASRLVSIDPSFSFAVYSATYAVAHALHNVLQCGDGKCNSSITVYPYMVLAALKKSNFTLLNHRIQFDENGDPNFGSYSIVFWNASGDAEEIGVHTFFPSVHSCINGSKVQWYTNGEVPTSLCSTECSDGYAKEQDGIHKCCFTCEICPYGSYVNSTEDAYTCMPCAETEWSTEGSTSCNLRLVEYIRFTDGEAILIMVGALVLVGITLAMSVLFAINYNTPVVRSAGGPMCFLILGCLDLSSVSVFFYIDKPTLSYCILRYLPFFLFFSVCIACFVVRSFQIVCIFKIAAKFPNIYSWWIKYHGQWLIITMIFVTQALLSLIGYSHGPPQPYNETVWYPERIILRCDVSLKANSASAILLLLLCSLCFVFSYMGKDLPKNYNEAKVITFCLLLLILTWTGFATEFMLYRGKQIETHNALAILSSLYSFLLWYFLPKCYIILYQPHKNTQKYFQDLIQNYTKTISQ